MADIVRQRLQSLLLALTLLVPLTTFALSAPAGAVDIFSPLCTGQNDTSTNASNTDVCGTVSKNDGNPFIKAIRIGVTIVSLLTGIAAVVVLVVSGLNMITSSGEPQAVARARKGITFSLVGIAVALVAVTLVNYVLNRL